MRIFYTYRGTRRTAAFPPGEILVGRLSGTIRPELDLSSDINVSRRHARIWEASGQVWIEDLGSRAGTFVNGQRIPGAVAVLPGDTVSLGDTVLQILPGTPDRERAAGEVDAAEFTPGSVIYAEPVEESERPAPAVATVADPYPARLMLLYELLAHIPRRQSLDTFTGIFLSKLLAAVPDAQRGTLQLLDPETKQLVLKAYLAPGEPAVSETLSRQALIEQKPVVWRRIIDRTDASRTALLLDIKAALYVPIIWQERVLGVLSLDNTARDLAFTEEDVKLVTAAAQLAAAHFAAHESQERLQFKTGFYQRFLHQFSAETLGQLAGQARRAALVPMAARSEITLLALRFSRADRAAADPAAEGWPEHCDSALEIIQAAHGSLVQVDEHQVLAVFGSPEPDAHQHEHALRAALTLRTELKRHQTRRVTSGEIADEFRLALHTATALHGFFGTAQRMIFQVLGEPVARVTTLAAAAAPAEILATRETYQRSYQFIQTQRVMLPRGPAAPMEAYRIIGVREKS